jgi:hypothetical protein
MLCEIDSPNYASLPNLRTIVICSFFELNIEVTALDPDIFFVQDLTYGFDHSIRLRLHFHERLPVTRQR